MKPILTRREIGEGLWHLRKTVRLLGRIAAGELPPPRTVERLTNDRPEWVWRDWLAENAEQFPFELVPNPTDVGLQIGMLEACAHPLVRNVVERAGTGRAHTWTVDVVRLPVSFLAHDALGIDRLAAGRIDALVARPGGQLWDATFLWALAWWATWGVKVRNDVGLLRGAWALAGPRLADRLTMEEIWTARRTILRAL
jgi:hypothetical protein